MAFLLAFIQCPLPAWRRVVLKSACVGCYLFWCAQAYCAQLDVRVLSSKGEPVEGVVISLHNNSFAVPEPQNIEVQQSDRRFSPQISLANVGSTVTFSNADTIIHHVYSFSKPWRRQFRLGKSEVKQEVMDTPGEVVLGCNIHDWMLAYIYVMDTPYYARTNESGLASFSDIPATKAVLRIRHPRIRDGRGKIERDIEIRDGSANMTEIRLRKRLLSTRNQVPNDDEFY